MVGGHRASGRAAALAAALAFAGCQPRPSDRTSLALAQTPPTVRAAYEQYYAGTPVRSITRESRGGQSYYTFQYGGGDGAGHEVVFNEAGNEIQKR